MSIQFRAVTGNFSDYVYAILTRFEAPHLDPRDVGDGKVTIGLGINLNASPVNQNAVFTQLGLILPTDAKFATGTALQQAHERLFNSIRDHGFLILIASPRN